MRRDLSRLLFPRSLAVIGGSECDIAVRRTREFAFDGVIHTVHPKRDELGGIKTVASVDLIEGPIDAAFVAVKREPTIEIVRTLRKKGCGGAVIYASGFAEAGAEDLQDALLAAADGMPLMGPNCYGYVNSIARVALWPDEHGIDVLNRGVAIVSQSGNIACNLAMTRRALPLAGIFTVGNIADVDIGDMVEALASDDRVTAIGLHIEGLRDVRAFARAAAFAKSRKKPLIALKTGRSEQGARATLSHTSSLAGADTLYDALFARYGIARVASVTAFVETLKFLHYCGPLADSRLVSMSCSGGEAALIADMALDRKVSFPPFDEATRQNVSATLSEFITIDNPLDYHTFIWRQEDKLAATFSAALSGGFDLGLLVLDVPTRSHMSPAAWLTTARAFQRAATETEARAAIVATLPECMPLDLAYELAAHGIAPMMGLDDALTAFEAAATIGRHWDRSDSLDLLPIARRGKDSSVLSEFEAKALLKVHGLNVPDGTICAANDAATAADRIGYPVTLKVSSSTIVHKTEAGGVALNLGTREDVTREAERLGTLWQELLVERMVTGAVAELIVGVSRDPQFGLALVIGAGGVLTEFLKDTATLLLPTNRAEIEQALRSLKVWTLIEGHRGKRGDARATIDAIEAVARFAENHDSLIDELDVNPLLVLPDGAIAVDAFIRMRTP